MPKADRLLAVLWLLRSRGSLTAAQIAGELGVTVRTVYRYIDGLCASGAPIASEGGPGGGYLLLDTFREPPVFFDAGERAALLHASMFADRAGYPFSTALHRALDKIRYRMSSDQLEELERHGAALGVVAGSTTGANDDEAGMLGPLAAIESAAAASRCIEIDYAAIGGGRRGRRTIEPYGVIHWSERWYVVAYCRLRKGIRVFRVDRISSIKPLEERFSRPEGFSTSDWFAETLIPSDPGDEPPLVVRLEGTEASVDHLARNWFLRRFVTARTERSLELRLARRSALEHLPGILLGYGTSLRVVEPRELESRLGTLATEVASFHSTAPN